MDHGKTTLADNLIESNGIISERLAGTLRYMDSDEEEQRRGITMKSSAIALRHLYSSTPKTQQQQMVIHLIDSPGHVDFGSEVSSALLACDGALVVVDVVEGMCARTHSVLREAHINQLIPILVVNKIDRLHSELGLSPTEAYIRIRELVETINAASAAILITSKQQQQEQEHPQGYDNDTLPVDTENNQTTWDHTTTKGITEDEEHQASLWNFDPSRGNVVFCSAIHGWGFTVPSLSRSLFRSKKIFAPKFKPAQIRQLLFCDVRYHAKTEKVIKWRHTQQHNHDKDEIYEPLFAQLALRPLWNIYDCVARAAASSSTTSTYNNTTAAKITAEITEMDLIVSQLEVGATASTGGNHSLPQSSSELQGLFKKLGASSEESILRAILRRYRPLSEAVLDSVCEILPPPSKLSRRALTLKHPPTTSTLVKHPNFPKIERAVLQCDIAPDSPTVAYVCKFMTVKRSDIVDSEMKQILQNKTIETIGDNDGDILVALVRVLSGTMQSCIVEDGDNGATEYYEIYGPKYDPSSSHQPIQVKKNMIKLYLLMGASLVRVKSIPAGHICAAFNLSDLQLKTMTICDTPGGMPVQGCEVVTRPLVKVNVEAWKSSETSILERGLQRLSLADAAVEVTATSKGERILACQGELHLEKSILDLKKTYCEQPIELRISDPIAEFGESTDYFEEETTNFNLFYSSKRQPLRQTIIPPYCEEEGLLNAKLGRCRVLLPDRRAALRIRTLPLTTLVYQCLNERRLVEGSELDLKLLAQALGFFAGDDYFDDFTAAALFISRLCTLLCSMDSNGNCIIESWDVRHGLGVKGILSNDIFVYEARLSESGRTVPTTNNDEVVASEILESSIEDAAQLKYEALEQLLKNNPTVPSFNPVEEVIASRDSYDLGALNIYKSEIRGSLSAGFQLAMRSGPFLEEPVRGVLVVIEGVEIAVTANVEKEEVTCIGLSPSVECIAPSKVITAGMIVSAIRQGIRCSLLSRPARVVEAHLRLTLHTSLVGLGPLYAVLSKRRGKVLSDTIVEGTDLILITANLPQSESFGLSQELLKQSSGEVTAPELIFSHFEVLKEDPFWVPTSEEEIEEFGEIDFSGEMALNKSLSIIRDVRKRKGLLVDSSKIVVAAEKQRTLSKKK